MTNLKKLSTIFKNRWRDAAMPYQNWQPFPSEAIVLVKNKFGDRTIAQAKDLWWGYEQDLGCTSEGVIIEARRLDRPKRGGNHENEIS